MPEADTSEFLLRACHDLRSAARAIGAHAELLRRSAALPPEGDLAERFGFIAEGARKIDLVIDGLSAYSLALAIHPDDFTAVPMEALLRTAIAKLSKPLREANAQVTHDPLPGVPGSADRLLEMWLNLLSSALGRARFAGSAPHIHAAAVRDGASYLFSLRDNVPFPAGELENLFRPFARLSAAHAPDSGLAICRAIVARHGGRIWAEAQSDSTVAIYFTLPASEDE